MKFKLSLLALFIPLTSLAQTESIGAFLGAKTLCGVEVAERLGGISDGNPSETSLSAKQTGTFLAECDLNDRPVIVVAESGGKALGLYFPGVKLVPDNQHKTYHEVSVQYGALTVEIIGALEASKFCHYRTGSSKFQYVVGKKPVERSRPVGSSDGYRGTRIAFYRTIFVTCDMD